MDLTPIANELISLAAVAIAAAAGFITRYVIRYLSAKVHLTNSQFETEASEKLSMAINYGINYAMAFLKTKIADPESPIRNITFDNVFIDMAAKYVLSSVPDILEHFGITEDRLTDMVLSRLNKTLPIPEVDSGAPQL